MSFQHLKAGQLLIVEEGDADLFTAVLQAQSLRASATSPAPPSSQPAPPPPAEAAAVTPPPKTAFWNLSLPSIVSRLSGQQTEGSASDEQQSSSSTPDVGISVLVLMTAEWCGPCSLLQRELPKLASQLSSSKLAHVVLVVDVDKNKELASQLRVTSLPMLVYLGSDETKPPFYSRGVTTAAVMADTLANKCVAFGGCNIQHQPWPML